MSDRRKSDNMDNQNTRTTYIPPEIREQYRQNYGTRRPQNTQQSRQQSQPRPQYQQRPQSPQPQYQDPYPYQNPQQYQQPQQPYPYQQPTQYSNPPQYQQSVQYQQPQYQNPQPYPAQRPPKKKPQQKKSSPPPKKKKKHKSRFSKFIGRLILVLFIILLLLFGVYSCTVYKLIGKMDYSETGARSRTDNALARNYVTSVLLIGTDGRSDVERGRSDTMMLLSVNSRTNTVTLTSFMRDCYVEIPDGYGWDKLNSAYSYGGAELLMDTIEHNFGVQIDDYISVNFVSFSNIIDAVGGIEIDVSDAEAQEINTILQAEVNSIMGDDTFADLLKGGGKLLLNGKQALSYARIRYVGNADFERTERQRRVMELAIDKLKSFAPSAISKISDSVMPNVSTNMTSQELYMLSLRVPFMAGYETEQLQIPAESTYYGEYTASGDALIVDFDANYNIIKENVFSD